MSEIARPRLEAVAALLREGDEMALYVRGLLGRGVELGDAGPWSAWLRLLDQRRMADLREQVEAAMRGGEAAS